MKSRCLNRYGGFSLLEVLTAVAVLSFGLLALASLQSSLIRSSSETKARSVALSLAKDRVEDLRAFRTIAEYEALTETSATLSDSTYGFGGHDYTVATTVTRFAFDADPDGNPATDDGAFEAVASDIGELTGTFVENNEFKRVSVQVTWTDANGVNQNVVIEDAIGALPPENTGRLARRKGELRNRGPQVLIQDPSVDPGVIPIAIGEGSETAATNPRPDVNTGVSLQTSYDIFTYAALNDNSNNARAQSRVETAIIGCRCDKANAVTGAVDYRPTYWDGERYIAPKEATGYSVQAGEADLQNNDPAQSILCSTCCRDHHDPDNVGGALFSPRRDDHDHFLDDLTTPATGEYQEACRMIRVDGIFSVAVDPYNEYTNILKTSVADGETDPFTDPAPDTTAQSNYVSFVIDYLATQGRQANPNTQLTQTAADGKAQTAGLNDTASTIEVGNERWMHGRGLYLDYLQPEAINAIDDSQEDCPNTLTDDECLLRVLPFTSINITELAKWTPDVETIAPIQVANGDFVLSANEDNPVRGRVTAVGDGTASAAASIRTSNTGLLANKDFRIDLADETAQTNNVGDQPDVDGHSFVIQGPACGLLPTTISIAAGGTGSFESTTSCAGSDTSEPTATTRIRLRLFTDDTLGPDSTASIVLIGPDNTPTNSSDNPRYTVATNLAWSAIPDNFEFEAIGEPDVSGTWTVQVTNNDNGQTDNTRVGWSLSFLYTAPFVVGTTGYTYVSTTNPGLEVSSGGGCDPLSSGNNPTQCDTTAPDTPNSTLGIGNYNYEAIGPARAVDCPGLTTGTTCAGVTLYCKNFDLTGVAIDSVTQSLTLSVTGGGTKDESTAIAFPNGFAENSQILLTFVDGTATAPSCTPRKQGNNFVCPGTNQNPNLGISCP